MKLLGTENAARLLQEHAQYKAMARGLFSYLEAKPQTYPAAPGIMLEIATLAHAWHQIEIALDRFPAEVVKEARRGMGETLGGQDDSAG